MTVHLHWNYEDPEDYVRMTRAVAVCGAQFLREFVTADPAKVTCDTCLERYHDKRERIETMLKQVTVNIHDLSGPQLVAAYNAMREGHHAPIKKFRDLETGRRSVMNTMTETPVEKVEEILRQVAAVPATQEVEAPAAATATVVAEPADVAAPAPRQAAAKSKKKGGISDADEIQVLDHEYGKDREKATATMKRWQTLLELEPKTVGEYRKKVGDKCTGDVKWWIEHKRISLKSQR